MSDLVEFIERSSYRVKVLNSLASKVKMPHEIAKDTEISKNNISNVLRALKEKGLIECVNPETTRGRLYRITKEGEAILNQLK